MFLCDFSLHHFMLKQDSIQVRALKVDDIKGSEVADKKVFFLFHFLFSILSLSPPFSLSLISPHIHTYMHTQCGASDCRTEAGLHESQLQLAVGCLI